MATVAIAGHPYPAKSDNEKQEIATI